MKGELTLTLDDGSVHHGVIDFVEGVRTGRKSKSEPATSLSVEPADEMDFTLPIRPFMSRYAGTLSGPKKLVLLVAHFSKGELDVPVARADVLDAWGKMTGLLGNKYNDAHPTRARDAGWLYSPESGQFALRNSWKGIFE